jgi:hypothetical protein
MYVNSGYVHGAAVQWRATVEPVDGFSNPATVDVFSNPADGPETQFQQARPGSCTARATHCVVINLFLSTESLTS